MSVLNKTQGTDSKQDDVPTKKKKKKAERKREKKTSVHVFGGRKREKKMDLKTQNKVLRITHHCGNKKKIPSNKEGQADFKILSQVLEILNHTKHHDFKAYKHKRIKVSVPPKSLRKQRLVLSTAKKHKSYGCSMCRKA